MKPKYSLILLFLCSITIMQAQIKPDFIKWDKSVVPKKQLTESQKQQWHHLDIERDSIPGISLERTFKDFIKKKRGKEVIVAIIDEPINIAHEQLKNYIWQNKNEIIGNNLDDDKNGYIDDSNGWNFLGNKNGDIAQVQHQSTVRFLKRYGVIFKDKTPENILLKDSLLYKEYLHVKNKFDEELALAKKEVEYATMIRGVLSSTKKVMRTYFRNDNYSLEDLDSLKIAHYNDTLLKKQILKRHNFIKYGFTDEYISNYEWESHNRLYKTLNFDFNEREVQQDNPVNIEDRYYGNGIVNANLDRFTHGTRAAGPIALLQDNLQMPITIKIMPIVVSSYKSIYEKDIALAIKYAVDNGAKVINMSFSIDHYINKKWVPDAIKYAEKNNVILITSAGNNNLNIDFTEIPNYPNDFDEVSRKEFSSNFITVGSSTYHLDKSLRAPYSSYGKENVDIFTPGDSIYTTMPNNKYRLESGTSMSSSVTSSVAALLFSYYPTLTAAQVKQIIMDSGVAYTIPVAVPTEENPDQLIPFNELSKSGKILNAYNAFIMAEQIVKK